MSDNENGIDLSELKPSRLRGRGSSKDGVPKPQEKIETPGERTASSRSSSRGNGRPSGRFDPPEVSLPIPDPAFDFRTYARVDAAFRGISGELEDMRRNQGRIGFSAQNAASDISKAAIDAMIRGDEAEAEAHMRAYASLLEEFGEFETGLADHGHHRFSRTLHQEYVETLLFPKFMAVIRGASDEVPELPAYRDFDGNIQSFIYGFVDVATELSKAVDDIVFSERFSPDDELEVFRRYIIVVESILRRLSEERHVPNYIISNGYGRWNNYSNKIRNIAGVIAHKKRAYNERRFLLEVTRRNR